MCGMKIKNSRYSCYSVLLTVNLIIGPFIIPNWHSGLFKVAAISVSGFDENFKKKKNFHFQSFMDCIYGKIFGNGVKWEIILLLALSREKNRY